METIIYSMMIVASLVLIFSVVASYWRNGGHFRQGDVNAFIVAIALMTIPIADKFSLSWFGITVGIGDEGLRDVSDNVRQLQDRIASLKKEDGYLSKEVGVLRGSIVAVNDDLSKFVTLYREKLRTPDDKAIKLTLIKEVLPDNFGEYSVVFKKITFHEICEKLNSVGEFYYRFSINGNTVAELSPDKIIKKKRGEDYQFSDKKVVVKSFAADDKFNLSGYVREYDGKTLISKSIKYTVVGILQGTWDLKEGTILIPIGEADSTVCRASLVLSVNKLPEIISAIK